MTGSFPASAGAASPSRFTGTVSIINRSPSTVSGMTSPTAEVFVTRDGEIVATPVARDALGLLVDLAPGTSRAFPATGSLLRCAAGEEGGDRVHRRLPAGRYEAYAVVNLTEMASGRELTVVGGPWPLAVT
jgi:hypothetical protein